MHCRLGDFLKSDAAERRHRFSWRVVSAVVGVLLAGAVVATVPRIGHSRSSEIFPVVDLHVDLPYQVGYQARTAVHGVGQFQAEWLRGAGVVGVVLPLYIPHHVRPSGPQMSDLEESYARMIQLLPAVNPYDLSGCRAEQGRTAVFWSLEGAAPLGEELDAVWQWGRRELKLVGLVHSADNSLATSSGYGFRPRRVSTGLSRLGREVVRRVHATGGLIDVSHASDRSFEDLSVLAQAAGVPLVATHSNARALAHHTRNLTDTQIRAIAATGGVVGVNFHSPFLLGAAGTAGLEDVVRHIRHLVRIAGVEHVALGSDFEGGIRPPLQLADVRGFPLLGRALLDAGFDRDSVASIMGGNARRILCAPH